MIQIWKVQRDNIFLVRGLVETSFFLTFTSTVVSNSLRYASSENVTQKEKVYPKGDSEENGRSVSE